MNASFHPLNLRPASAGPRELDDPILVCLDGYRPRRLPAEQWTERVREFHRGHLLRLDVGEIGVARDIRSAFAHLICFAVSEGIPLDIERVLDPDTVERHFERKVARGIPNAAANERALLRRLGRCLTEKAPWEPVPEAWGRTKLGPPYPEADVELIHRDVTRQATPRLCLAGETIEILGLGAGLDGRWSLKIRGTDVREQNGLVLIDVPPPRARIVVVRNRYADRLVELAKRAGPGRIAGTADKTQCWEISRDVVIDRCRLELVPGRLRTTWLVAHIRARTQLGVLLKAAGLGSPSGLDDLRPYMPPVDDDEGYRQLGST